MRPMVVCSYCNANNPTDSARCSSCDSPLPYSRSDETRILGSQEDPDRTVLLGTRTVGASQPSAVSSPAPSAETLVPGNESSGSATLGPDSPTLGGEQFKERFGAVPLPGMPDFGKRYRVEGKLGEGGMGAVYKAFDTELGRPVALKLIRPELMLNAGAQQRFKQELLLASRVSHKNILRIHDLGEANGTKFISMAFVDGTDLAHMIRHRGRLGLDQTIQIGLQLCAALEAAHSEGVVHRDLKPQNVMIDRSGQTFVSDFGLAKSLTSDGELGMTMTGEVLGTPRYMSPEQVECKPVDGRSDIYALGLILYEMLTGNVPFAGNSAFQVMLARVQNEPGDPRNINPEIPEPIAKIILRCLEKDPARRYQTAEELAQDLRAQRATESAVRKQPVFSPPHTREEKPSKPRSWMQLVWALVALVAVSGGLIKRFLPKENQNAEQNNAASTAAQHYVAVLPFKVLGQDSAMKLASQGITESLNAKLFAVQSVQLAPASAIAKENLDRPIEELARKFGSNQIIEGTVQGAADRLRITVSLWDRDAGKSIWSQEYSGVQQDLITIEDQIYSGVSNALGLQLSAAEQARASEHPTENADAYQMYLEGRTQMRGSYDKRNVRNAIELFTKATKTDPTFALAYAGLADASILAYQKERNNDDASRALNAAQQAAQINNRLPEVHITLGTVYAATGKTSEAISELQQAVKLAPNSDEAYRKLARTLNASGRADEAYKAYKEAIRLNPYFWLNYYETAAGYMRNGKFADAENLARRVTELDAANSAGFELLGNTYFQQGKYQEAIPQFKKSLAIKEEPTTYSNLGTALYFMNNFADAADAYEKAVKLNPNDQVQLGNLGDAYRALHRRDAANEAYKRAISAALNDLKTNPRDATTLGSLALYFAKSDQPQEAVSFIRRARAINGKDVNLIYNQALVQTLAKNNKAAIESLKQAVTAGLPIDNVKSDPEFAPLHDDPAYQSLLAGKK